MRKTLLLIVAIVLAITANAQQKVSRNWTAFSQKIEVSADTTKTFKIIAYAKAENLDDKAWSGLWARVDNKGNQGYGFFDNMGDRPIKSGEWKPYEINGTIDSKSATINFGGICSYNGRFFFDKFEVFIEDSKGELQLADIKNANFEEEIADNTIPGWSQGISMGDETRVKQFTFISSEDAVDGKYAIVVEGKGISEMEGNASDLYPNIGIFITLLYLIVLGLSLLIKLTATSETAWTPLGKIGFRFSFIYFLFIIVFQNNGAYPFFDYIVKKPAELMQSLVLWFGESVIEIPYTINIGPNGSGDTTYDYLVVLVSFLVAIIGTIIWSILDRKRDSYDTLYYWLTTAVRYYVGLMLISYGLVKVIQLQFPEPGFYRLLQDYGDSSPMGLAWTFLGFSKGYNMFMGIAEVLAGLLLFRRTLTLGAVITLMTTMNVMAVNYFYDVPVKVLSTHLVIMTLFLLSRDIKKVMTFLVTNSQVEKLGIILRPKLHNGLDIGLEVLKGLVITYALGYGFYQCLESQKTYGSEAPKPELYGVYEVSDFVINGDTITNYKNNKLWRNIRFERVGAVQVEKMNKERAYYRVEVDTTAQNIKFFTSGSEYFDFNYTKTEDTLDFNYIHENDTVSGTTKRLDKSDFLLTNRGFHWINEYPFNR